MNGNNLLWYKHTNENEINNALINLVVDKNGRTLIENVVFKNMTTKQGITLLEKLANIESNIVDEIF